MRNRVVFIIVFLVCGLSFHFSAQSLELLATYVGGGESDWGNAIEVDVNGNVIVIGYSNSMNFPTTAGAYDTSTNGSTDIVAFVLSPGLDSLLHSTFIGGSDTDIGNDMLLTPNGNVVITGVTSSSDFPVTLGAYDTSYNSGAGTTDAFIIKLSSDLSALHQATFIGGSVGDEAEGIAIDASGNLLITGYTISTDFPVTPDAYDTTGGSDTFISILSPDLSSLLHSTYLGGVIGFESGKAICLDQSGNVIVTGRTESSDFPTIPGSYDVSYNGEYDVFTTKLSSDLSTLIASTYVGGSDNDGGWDCAIDRADNIVLTGYASSSNFPSTPDSYDPTHNAGSDVFVLKFSPDMSELRCATFIGGGDGPEWGRELFVIPSGRVIVAGETFSADFPVTPDAYNTQINGGADAYVLKLSEELDALIYSTFVGGSDAEEPHAMTLDSNGAIVVTGYTRSTDLPVHATAFDTSFNGNYDVFVFKLASTVTTGMNCTPASGTVPFPCAMEAAITNNYQGQSRRFSAHIDTTLANGNYFSNWRAGYTNVAAGNTYSTSWNTTIPALGSVVGTNIFKLVVADVTPAPYNQPPYPGAGDTDTDICVVEGIAP